MSRTIRMADGDFFFNSGGRAEVVEDENKVSQDVAEVLLTRLDAERDYGSELSILDIPPQVSIFAGKALLSKKIDEAIQRLKRFQMRDPAAGSTEVIDKIGKLIIEQIGPGEYIFWINVELQDGTITPDRILATSLRHQLPATVAQPLQQLIPQLRKKSVA